MTLSFTHAIVVGASSGIGEAIAKQLAASGTTVAVVARRTDELERIAKENPAKLRAYAHDATRFDEVPGLFEKILSDLGGCDLLVYAAGVMPNLAEGEYDFEKDRAMIEVNLLGAMAWCNPVAAHFEAARRGTLVGISSIAGVRGRRGNPAYCTSKAALSTYLESLRNRCSRYGVNVVTIKPGFVDTAMTQGKGELLWLISAEEAARQTLALARRGSSAEGFVPARWALVALIVKYLPSFIFRKLNL